MCVGEWSRATGMNPAGLANITLNNLPNGTNTTYSQMAAIVFFFGFTIGPSQSLTSFAFMYSVACPPLNRTDFNFRELP